MPAGPNIFTATCGLEAPSDLRAAAELCRQAREFLANAGLAAEEVDAWELALAEAANNAVKHCRPDAARLPVRVDLFAAREWIEVRVTDHTPGFDWPEKAELPPDDCESGRGVFLIQNLTDESHYLRGRGENCLVLRKRRSPAKETPAPPQPDPAQELAEARRTLDLMTEELAPPALRRPFAPACAGWWRQNRLARRALPPIGRTPRGLGRAGSARPPAAAGARWTGR